jgi:hypothetical protein
LCFRWPDPEYSPITEKISLRILVQLRRQNAFSLKIGRAVCELEKYRNHFAFYFAAEFCPWNLELLPITKRIVARRNSLLCNRTVNNKGYLQNQSICTRTLQSPLPFDHFSSCILVNQVLFILYTFSTASNTFFTTS